MIISDFRVIATVCSNLFCCAPISERIADTMLEPDKDEYYDAPAPSPESVGLEDYPDFINKESNRKKYNLPLFTKR